MKMGVTVDAELTLYRVQIEGRGGDSIRDEYFDTDKGATFAAAMDGHQDQNPLPVRAYRLSDGSLILDPQRIQISIAPTQATVKRKLTEFSPRLKKLLGI